MILRISRDFHVAVVNIFFWLYCNFSECSLGLNRCSVLLQSLSIAKAFQTLLSTVSSCQKTTLGRFVFVILVESTSGFFCLRSFHSYCSTKQVLMNSLTLYAFILFDHFINKIKIHTPIFIFKQGRCLHSLEFLCGQSIVRKKSFDWKKTFNKLQIHGDREPQRKIHKQQHLESTTFAISPDHILEGTQVLFSLVLAFLLQTKAGEIQAASKNVVYMSGTLLV